MRRARLALLRLALLTSAPLGLLSGCDQLGIESATTTAAKRDAEGRAVGGACRHAARVIEQCYVQNKRADKAAVFAGWREMNDYMRENKIEAVPASAAASSVAAQGDAADETQAEKGVEKGADKQVANAGGTSAKKGH